MALRKVAPSAQWATGRKGAAREAVPWISDGTDYEVTPGGGDTDGGFVLSSGDLEFTPAASRSRTYRAGASDVVVA